MSADHARLTARRKAGYADAIADASHWHDRIGSLVQTA